MARDNLVIDSNSKRYYVRWYIDGRERRKSLGTKDYREAVRLAKPLLAEINANRAGVQTVRKEAPSRGPTWEECVLLYQQDETWPKAASTQKRYLIDLRRAGEFLAEKGLRPGEANKATVSAYVNDCRLEELSASSIRNALTAWSRVIDAPVHLGVIPGDNYVLEYSRRRIREDAVLMDPPINGEFARMLPEIAAYDADLALFADFLYRTGCRLTEALQARRSDIVTAKNGDLLVHLRMVKGGPGRERAALLNSAEDLLPRLSHRGRLFTALRLSTAAISGRWSRFFDRRQEAARQAAQRTSEEPDIWQMRRWRLHDLRHAFAIEAIREGAPIGLLQAHLGHASVTTTERYIKAMRRLPLAEQGVLKRTRVTSATSAPQRLNQALTKHVLWTKGVTFVQRPGRGARLRETNHGRVEIDPPASEE